MESTIFILPILLSGISVAPMQVDTEQMVAVRIGSTGGTVNVSCSVTAAWINHVQIVPSTAPTMDAMMAYQEKIKISKKVPPSKESGISNY